MKAKERKGEMKNSRLYEYRIFCICMHKRSNIVILNSDNSLCRIFRKCILLFKTHLQKHSFENQLALQTKKHSKNKNK
jgi:hypothetical protein